MKRFTIAVAVLFTILFTIPAHADIWSNGSEVSKDRLTENASIPGLDPGSLLAEITAAANYLGVREGTFYDAHKHEFTNYAAATLYTEPNTHIALDFGMLNTDGVAVTADWNVGATIPSEGVPIASMLQYLYIGGGICDRYIDKVDGDDTTKSWQFGYGADVQFKGTF